MTQNPDLSRKGSVTFPTAAITDAELDTIEAEIDNPEKRLDIFSVLVAVFSAALVCVNVVTTSEWYKDNLKIALLVAGFGLMVIQGYRAWIVWRRKPSRHEANARKYLNNLRQVIGSKSSQI